MQKEKKINGSDSSLEDFSKTTSDYSKALRNWFVAYGVGAPILFLSKDNITSAILKSPDSKFMIYLFFFGLGIQVFNALLNKWLSWGVSEYIANEKKRLKWYYQFAVRLNRIILIDFIIDVSTLISFIWATIIALSALTK